MKKAVLSNRILLNKTDELMDELISELTYVFKSEKPNAKPETLCLVTGINADIISIPIGRIDLIPKDYTIIDKRTIAPVAFPKNNITLRETQQEIYDKLHDSCIINAKPGWGKTFTALAIAAKLGQKTLVIVHTVKLRKQWEKEVYKVFGIRPSIIGTGKFETKGPIVLANIQTLRKHILKVSSMFGTVIQDEAHHVPANTFRNILDKLRARYKIGLSGTLGRKDQKHVILPDYFGKVIYKPFKENVLDPTIIVYPSSFRIPGNFMEPWATRINKLAYNPNYQAEVANLAHAQTERGHKVLVVSDRIDFLEACDSISIDSVCITSKTKNQEQLEESIRKGINNILYGSISIYKEGISIKELSCIILASPINNIYLLEQLVGRVNRLCDNKKKPEVVDIVLSCKTGKKQFKTRNYFYISEGYKIVVL